MRAILLIAACVFCATSASATDSSQCDSKPFTLNKPSETAQKPAPPQPKLAEAAPEKPKPVTQPKPAPKPKAKPRLISTCKDGKKKEG